MNNINELNIKFDNDITLVIATIGENSLNRTIRSILCGSIVPHKILLCIPEEKKEQISSLSSQFKCIHILPTKEKGQVIQRILGFKHSTTKYTVQLDSDVEVEENLIENLKKTLLMNPGACVGPVIYKNNNKEKYSFLSSTCNLYSPFEKKLMLKVLNGKEGFKSGILSKGGVGFGPEMHTSTDIVEWLPGCCVMHETKNLIMDNFYPFAGKAYSEDMFHSHFINNKDIQMIISNEAKIFVDFPILSMKNFSILVKEQFYAFRAHSAYVKLADKSLLRFLLFSILNIFFLVKKRVFS